MGHGALGWVCFVKSKNNRMPLDCASGRQLFSVSKHYSVVAAEDGVFVFAVAALAAEAADEEDRDARSYQDGREGSAGEPRQHGMDYGVNRSAGPNALSRRFGSNHAMGWKSRGFCGRVGERIPP
jgi:hypothetical protein